MYATIASILPLLVLHFPFLLSICNNFCHPILYYSHVFHWRWRPFIQYRYMYLYVTPVLPVQYTVQVQILKKRAIFENKNSSPILEPGVHAFILLLVFMKRKLDPKTFYHRYDDKHICESNSWNEVLFDE